MRPLENVWIYVDAEGPIADALAVAIEAARRSGATLTLVGAIGRREDPVFETSFGHRILRLVREDRAARLAELALVARAALPAGRVRSTMVDGELPWETVVVHALERSPDLLVVPARRDGGDRDTAALQVLRHHPVLVWAVEAGGRSRAVSPARPEA